MRNETAQRPIGELVQDATRQASQLAHLEMELARTELREDAVAAATGAAGFGLAGAGALVGFIFLALAATFGIATALPLWASALIVAGVIIAGSGVCAIAGRRSMRRIAPPERTTRMLKEDAEWLRHPTS